LFFLAACTHSAEQGDWTLHSPDYFPPLQYDTVQNSPTAEGFQLGRLLFYDGLLSRDGTIACGSCHIQSSAFSHHFHDVSHGIDDQLGTRNASALQNLAFRKSFFWDGGVAHLDLTALPALTDPKEMDERLENVLQKLRRHPDYPARFEAAFGSKEITSERFLKAISQFLVLMVSANSRYDQYLQGRATLSQNELQGLRLFEQKCASCHSGTLFTDDSFRNNGLPPNDFQDQGRYAITLQEADRYKFRVPSLRNIVHTFPYMHDGRFYTLEQVLNHYQGGIQKSSTLDTSLIQPDGRLGIAMSHEEKLRIIDFLKTLSDESFLRDPRFEETGTQIIR
jgi:cytochrome c peroxidase